MTRTAIVLITALAATASAAQRSWLKPKPKPEPEEYLPSWLEPKPSMAGELTQTLDSLKKKGLPKNYTVKGEQRNRVPDVEPEANHNLTWQDVEAVRGRSRTGFFGAAEKFAVTHPRTRREVIPPVEYDRSYEGKLTVTMVESERELMTLCPKTKFAAKLGCAHQTRQLWPNGPWAECHIILLKEQITESWGFTLATIYPHELGHCNGWPGDHNGARMAP